MRYSPHMPRRAAPQGQGPGSAERPSREAPETAKTDSSFSTRVLEHFLQRIFVLAAYEIFSNCAPQSWHRYSKIGIVVLLGEYSQAA
jgi:hypothetical protein